MIALSLLDYRSDVLIKCAQLLETQGQNVCYFSNQNMRDIIENDRFLEFKINTETDEHPQLRSKFIEIYKNDRSLKYYLSEDLAPRVLASWLSESLTFIHKYDVKCAVIEGTPAHELIFEIACEMLGVKVINIFHAPGPRGWSLISSSSIEYPLYKCSQYKSRYLQDLSRKSDERKIYVDTKESWDKKIYRFIRREKNYNYYPKWKIILDAFATPFSLALSLILVKIKGNAGNSVFYLHMEPERTVSNCGAPFSSQKQALDYITNTLNINITLKEHPDWLGKRPLRFLIYVFLNPNLNYILKSGNSHGLTWTFSGSIAWENELNSKKTVILGNTYLKHAKNVYALFARNEIVSKEENFFDYIASHAFPCELAGANLSSYVMSDENIKNLSAAIMQCSK